MIYLCRKEHEKLTCLGEKDMRNSEELSIMMEIVLSPEVICLISQRQKDLKFPAMHFDKIKSEPGHLILKLLQWHKKLLLFLV